MCTGQQTNPVIPPALTRFKCDNQRPTCRKCNDSGRECAGYQRDIVFITATVDDGGRCSSHPPRRISTPSRGRSAVTPESPGLNLKPVEPLRPAWDDSILLSYHGDLCQFRVMVHHTSLRDVRRVDLGVHEQVKLSIPDFIPPPIRLVNYSIDLSVNSQVMAHIDRGRGTSANNTLLFLSEVRFY